jgi:capsular exopolysaccharide synthesis family protein
VIAPPLLGMKVSPSRRIILPVAAFAGILLGCMLAMAVELRDDSFHSCEQVQQQLGLPVVGQIPEFAPAKLPSRSDDPDADRGGVIDPMLCTYHGPRTLPAETFRTLRTSLYLNGASEATRVLQVSGAAADDGGSTVAANLAISLAQTGKRVLLIDADLREQHQYQMFGIDRPETGLAAMITADVEPVDAICQTSVKNLSLLPAGPLPEGPCELFSSPRFSELISLVRDSYDHVLIDTEPLLAASDPFVIASHADGVVLVLRLARDGRQKAQQAKQMMERLDVSILGVVVNRVSGATLGQRVPDRHGHSGSSQIPPRSLPEPTFG